MDTLRRRSHSGRLLRSCMLVAMLGALAEAVPVCAWAETQVDGQSDAIRLEVHGAQLGEVLDALSAKFKLHYRTTTALTQSIEGTYQGPLPQIITRMLDGYDRVIKSSDDGLDVFIYGTNKAATVATAGAAPKAVEPAAQPEGKSNDAPAAPAKTTPAIAISTPNAPVVAPWPPPPPPNQDSVVAMLGAAARSQIPGAGTAPPTANAPGGAGGMPSAADIAALTQNASALVQNLAAQLGRLPH